MGLRILLIDPKDKVIPRINTREKSPKSNEKRKKYTDEERLERDRESMRKSDAKRRARKKKRPPT